MAAAGALLPDSLTRDEDPAAGLLAGNGIAAPLPAGEVCRGRGRGSHFFFFFFNSHSLSASLQQGKGIEQAQGDGSAGRDTAGGRSLPCPAGEERRRGCKRMLHAERFPCPALPGTGLSKDTFQLTLATLCQNPVVLVPGRCAEQSGVPREAQWASGNHGGTGVLRHRDPGHIGDISWVARCCGGISREMQGRTRRVLWGWPCLIRNEFPRGFSVGIPLPLPTRCLGEAQPGEERVVPAHHSPCSPQINYPVRKKNEFLD